MAPEPLFYDCTSITPKSSHTYSATFPLEWCIGTVPHGGFITSCIQRVARTHFSTTLKSQNQPHTLTMHVEFVRRTEIGPATFTVSDVKLGRKLSTIHITLSQNIGGSGSKERIEVLAYVTQTNLETEQGASYPTSWSLDPAPAPSTPNLFPYDDKNWRPLTSKPFADFRKATQRVLFLIPTRGQTVRSALDFWIKFESGERLTNEALGMVVDMFPQVVESHLEEDAGAAWKDTGAEGQAAARPKAKFWYPTVLLNLDVKKLLPEQGVEWLFTRVRSKIIRNGRYDLEVVVCDDTGDVVALSHHVVLIVGSERNVAQRNRGSGGSGEKGQGGVKL